jgi:predicted nucleic acid-binding Zn ribbon protein
MSPSKEPTDLGRLLREAAASWGIEHPGELAALFSRWEDIVGERVARRCEPVSLKDGVLKVNAASAAWAAELRYLEPEIAKRVNEKLGPDLVREVVVAFGSPKRAAPTQRRRRNSR